MLYDIKKNQYNRTLGKHTTKFLFRSLPMSIISKQPMFLFINPSLYYHLSTVRNFFPSISSSLHVFIYHCPPVENLKRKQEIATREFIHRLVAPTTTTTTPTPPTRHSRKGRPRTEQPNSVLLHRIIIIIVVVVQLSVNQSISPFLCPAINQSIHSFISAVKVR